jgi:hypothetical protein
MKTKITDQKKKLMVMENYDCTEEVRGTWQDLFLRFFSVSRDKDVSLCVHG